MIKSQDRSKYFGASDTKYVIGNWNTKTFQKWWLEKLGIQNERYDNKYTLAGTNYEHKIIDALNIPMIEKDNQFIKDRIRVNLDANTKDKIYEIKTYGYEKGFLLEKHKDYVNQVIVQMFVSNIHSAEIVAYGLLENDYINYFNNIDSDRLSIFEIKYDEKWLEEEYLPRINYLTKCLIDGRFPDKQEYEEMN